MISEQNFHRIVIHAIPVKTKVQVQFSLLIQEYLRNIPVQIVTAQKHGMQLSLFNTMPISVFTRAIIKVNGPIVQIVIQMMLCGMQRKPVYDVMQVIQE